MMTEVEVRAFAIAVLARICRDDEVPTLTVASVEPDGLAPARRMAHGLTSGLGDSMTLTLVDAAGEVSGYARFTELGERDRGEAAAQLASQLQDAVLEAAWGTPAPRCPGHPHPLSVWSEDDHWWWVCPDDHSPRESGPPLGR